MTDWQAAGQLADAHRVANLVRDRYSSDQKAAVRKSVILALVREGPLRVLDLWGGGASAEEATAAGLSVVSVEDGRALRKDYRIASKRGQRALRLNAEEGGYEWRWGPAEKYASECDAAFLDFCGQWSPSMRRTLEACRHMSLVIVTVMAERTALGKLSVPDWITAYRALAISAMPGFLCRRVVSYRRPNGQHACVLFLRRGVSLKDETWMAKQHEDRRARRQKRTPDEVLKEREYMRAYRADPLNKARINSRIKAWREARLEEVPEWRNYINEQRRARRAARSALSV